MEMPFLSCVGAILWHYWTLSAFLQESTVACVHWESKAVVFTPKRNNIRFSVHLCLMNYN